MTVPTGRVEGWPSDAARPIRTSPATMVVSSRHGTLLLPPSGPPTVPIDLRGLQMLALLSQRAMTAVDAAEAIARRHDLASDPMLDLIAVLGGRGALVEVDGSDDHGPLATASTPTPIGSPETDPVDPEERQVLALPTVFRIHDGRFEHRQHDGGLRLTLSPSELIATSAWREPGSADEAYARFRTENPSHPLGRETFDDLSNRLRGADLLQSFDPERHDDGVDTASADEARDEMRRHMRILHATKIAVEQNAADGDGTARVPVIPIHDSWVLPPMSLGLIVAYAKAHQGGELERSYDFVPRWLVQPNRLSDIVDRPSVVLFSNYIWNSRSNLEISARLKAASPHSITIHGGPDTPKYESDVHRLFRDHPHVDVAVRGEGEATFAALLEALAGRIGDGPPDLSPLADVPGLSFRLGDRVITTPDRDRIADLDTIPSPYLTGVFDAYTAGPPRAVKLETNRGCPYGCTFCDWGSATNSRIRKFDLDRIFAEIEWAAEHGVHNLTLCDANFGIFERDVAIAEKIAEVKATHGFPQAVGNNYAKNTVKHLKDIIRIFADVGIIAEGIVSLQSTDTETLQVIRRKNIKVEKYTDLAAQFTKNRLPLAVDLMMGLPGATVAAFKNDLQGCADRDVSTRVHPTTMLTNSPMNEPAYRAEHGIVAKPGEVIKRTNTFDEDDWQSMWGLRQTFLLCDQFSVLRQVARYVRAETGLHEIAYYDRLMTDAFADPGRWPTIAFTLRWMPDLMAPPCSWSIFIDEIGDHLTSVLGVPDDDALATVLAAQMLHLPAHGRSFPDTMVTAHDITAWHQARVEACEAGHLTDWEQQIPPLRSYGPGTLTVDDPEDLCRTAIGGDLTSFSIRLTAWDLESPIARPRNTLRDDGLQGEVPMPAGS